MVGLPLFVGLIVLGTACQASRASDPSSPATPQSAEIAPGTPSASTAAPMTASGVPTSESSGRAPSGPPAPYSVTQLLTDPVSSIAVGKPPKVATFGKTTHVFDGKTWQAPALPEASRSQPLAANIFFGRDNQPRLLGSRQQDGTARPVYLRHKPRGWALEPAELGPLAKASGELYGILGYDDPEIVCAVGDVCLVKRLSGWKRIPAAPSPERFFPTTQGVYVARQGALFRLDDVEWVKFADIQGEPIGLCHDTPERLWYLTSDALYLRDAGGVGAVERRPSPVESPAALWCEGKGALWVVGRGGARHLEGDVWRPLPPELGALRAVMMGHGEVLLGGELGLFAARRNAE